MYQRTANILKCWVNAQIPITLDLAEKCEKLVVDEKAKPPREHTVFQYGVQAAGELLEWTDAPTDASDLLGNYADDASGSEDGYDESEDDE